MRHTLTFAVLAALLTATPAAAAAPAKKAAVTETAPAAGGGSISLQDLSLSAWIDGEFGDLDGVALRADAELPLMALTPKVKLVGIGSLGFTHLGASPSGFDVSWNMLKVLAIGRAKMNIAPKIDVFGDLGIGFYYGHASVEYPYINPVTLTWSTATAEDNNGGFTMRLAVGGSYDIDPRLSVSAEMGLNPYFGDADTTNFIIGVGASYKL